MANTTQINPEFSKFYEQRRKDEKNALFQAFVDELEAVLAGIKDRHARERTFNNSIGQEVRVIDSSDLKIISLIQNALKFNITNLNLIISCSEFFDILFSIFKTSGWNSSVHNLFTDTIKTSVNVNKSKQIIGKLSDKNNLVQVLHDCTKDNNCWVDNTKRFRKAYCGAVNEIGTLIHKLPTDRKQPFVDSKPFSY